MIKEREWKGYKEMYKKILALAGALVLLSGCGGKKVDVPGTETQTEATVTSPLEETTAAVETEETAESRSISGGLIKNQPSFSMFIKIKCPM